MKNNRWLKLPFISALIGGLMSGGIVKFVLGLETSDWAARGQPMLDRWLDAQTWFLMGFAPGAIVGAIIGVVWYWRT